MATAKIVVVPPPPPPQPETWVDLRLSKAEAIMLRTLLGYCSGTGPAYQLSYELYKVLADAVPSDGLMKVDNNPHIRGGTNHG